MVEQVAEISMVEQATEVSMEMSAASDHSCAHHWQIATPDGETSDASCKFCGATRSFANYSPGRTMTRSAKAPTNSGGGMRV